MNGLCQQCQVYYPMPDDFGSGTAYACPQCQTLLVPFDPDAPPPAPSNGGGEGAGWEAQVPGAGDDITQITALSGVLGSRSAGPPPPKPGDQVQVLWFHPHTSPEVSSAREAAGMPPLSNGALGAAAQAGAPAPESSAAVAGEAGAVSPSGDAQTAAGEAQPAAAPAADVAPPDGGGGEKPETTFVMRGAGAGVAREELPLEPVRRPAPTAAPEPAKPRDFEPVPRFRQITTAAPVKVRRRRPFLWAGIVAVAVVAVGAFYLTRSKTSAAKPSATQPASAPVAEGTAAPSVTGPAAPATPAGAEGTADTAKGGSAAPAPTAAAAPGATPAAPSPKPAAKTPAAAAHPGEEHAENAHHPAAPTPPKPHPAPPPHPHGAGAHPAPTPAPRPPKAKHHTKTAPAAVARHAKTPPAPKAKKPPTKVAAHEAGPAPKPAPPKPTPKPTPKPKPEAATAAAGGQGTSMSHVQQGNLLFRQGRLDQAIKEFEKALLIDGHNGLAHRGLGVAYAKLGRAEAAAHEYELYLKLMPRAPDAAQVRRIVDAYYAQKKQQAGNGK